MRPPTWRRCARAVRVLAERVLVASTVTAHASVVAAQLPPFTGPPLRVLTYTGCDPTTYSFGPGACGTGTVSFYHSPVFAPPLLLAVGTFGLTSHPAPAQILTALYPGPIGLVPQPPNTDETFFDPPNFGAVAPLSWTPQRIQLRVGYWDPDVLEPGIPYWQLPSRDDGVMSFGLVPEPATLGTVAVGALLLMLVGRRQRRRRGRPMPATLTLAAATVSVTLARPGAAIGQGHVAPYAKVSTTTTSGTTLDECGTQDLTGTPPVNQIQCGVGIWNANLSGSGFSGVGGLPVRVYANVLIGALQEPRGRQGRGRVQSSWQDVATIAGPVGGPPPTALELTTFLLGGMDVSVQAPGVTTADLASTLYVGAAPASWQATESFALGRGNCPTPSPCSGLLSVFRTVTWTVPVAPNGMAFFAALLDLSAILDTGPAGTSGTGNGHLDNHFTLAFESFRILAGNSDVTADSQIFFDNNTFGLVPAPVPEPRTWVLLAGGLTALGVVLARRRSR